MKYINKNDIKIKKDIKCLDCKTSKAIIKRFNSTHDGMLVLNYMCRCGEETVVYRKLKWV